MDRRYTFNQNVSNYDKFRPEYCKELFTDIIEYSLINNNSKCIEVGIGTGQATRPILNIGCEVEAVELGSNLANYTKEKFNSYKNFKVCNMDFESYENENIDLIYAATSFHWIPKEIGYPKAYKMLKNGGTIALFWNHPSVAEGKINDDIQKVYTKYRGSDCKASLNIESKISKIQTNLKVAGFKEIYCQRYYGSRIFSSNEYIKLLETYSDHIVMEAEIKNVFYDEIKEAIDKNGGSVTVSDMIDLHLGKKGYKF